MKTYILLDKNNIVRCIASNPANLHTNWSEDKSPKQYQVETGGVCGDEYNPETKVWTSRPENYPEPSNEELITKEMQRIQEQCNRAEAIENLKLSGKLPADFK